MEVESSISDVWWFWAFLFSVFFFAGSILFGYGSIPIDTFLVSYSSMNPSYFGVHIRYQGFDPSPFLPSCGLSFQVQIIGLSQRHGSAAPWFEGGTQRGKDPETQGLEGDGGVLGCSFFGPLGWQILHAVFGDIPMKPWWKTSICRCSIAMFHYQMIIVAHFARNFDRFLPII